MVILFEDAHLLVISKPVGLSTENGDRNHPSAESEAQQLLAQKAGNSKAPYLRAAHRLDRATGGVLVFAKSKAALTNLMGQFERKETRKTYRAWVAGAPAPENGVLEHFHKRSADGKSALILKAAEEGAAPCSLSYKTVRVLDAKAELQIQPATGRFHQIRAQLAFIGCPILGDTVYNGSYTAATSIKLFAEKLGIRHPRTGAEIIFEAPLPSDWEKDPIV